MTKNVAVVGLTEGTRDYLEDRMRTPGDVVHFVNAISREETIIHGSNYPFEELLETGLSRVKDAGAQAVMTYWDFPSTMLTAFIAKRAGLPYASVESVMKCEHKLWFRQEQAKVTEAPAFCSFDPTHEDPLSEITIDYPFWVKPVVGHSSMLGFEIENESDFREALTEIRDNIEMVAQPFSYALEHTELPPDLAEKGGRLCLAEEIISDGEQYTLEGYVRNGECFIYGVVASIRHPNGHTFARFQYPADLEEAVVNRMIEATEKIVAQIGFDGCPFNIEFFYDHSSGRLSVVEMNSRLSQSHSDIFNKVDGQPHQQIAVSLALDEEPIWRRRAGDFKIAAKCFLRHFEDATVVKVPDEEAFRKLREEMPDVRVDPAVNEGQRLSDLVEQESYSYEIADIFIGADSEEELLRKYDRCVEILDFRFE